MSNELKDLEDAINSDGLYRLKELKEIITKIWLYNLEMINKGMPYGLQTIPYLVSKPGIGKSSIIYQISKELMAHMEVIILNQFDLAELGGFPWLDRSGDTPTYRRARPFFLPPIDGEYGNDPQKPVILFWDETTQAYPANQNILSQATLEGRIGEHKFPKFTLQACASNDLVHRANTHPLGSQLASRLNSFQARCHIDDTLEYFNMIGVNPKIIATLKLDESLLDQFDPAQPNCPSPRAWHQCDPFVSNDNLTLRQRGIAMTGKVGKAATAKFAAIERIYTQLPDLEEIFKHPEAAEVPRPEKGPELMYVLLTALASRANENNATSIITYARRMMEWYSEEYANYLVASMLERTGGRKSSPLARRHKDVKAYIREFASDLFWTELSDQESAEAAALVEEMEASAVLTENEGQALKVSGGI